MSKSKKALLLCSLLIILVVLSFMHVLLYPEQIGAAQTKRIQIFIENEQVEFPDQQPVIIGNRVMVPMRAVYQHEKVQAEVRWEPSNQTIIAVDQTGRRVIFKVGDHHYQILNRVELVQNYSDVAPVIQNGRTLLPLRTLAEALNFQVEWIEAERRVEIKEKEGNSPSDRGLMPPADWREYLRTGRKTPSPSDCFT